MGLKLLELKLTEKLVDKENYQTAYIGWTKVLLVNICKKVSNWKAINEKFCFCVFILLENINSI